MQAELDAARRVSMQAEAMDYEPSVALMDFDTLAGRARKLNLLSEAQLDQMTDDIASGTRSEADAVAELRQRLRQRRPTSPRPASPKFSSPGAAASGSASRLPSASAHRPPMLAARPPPSPSASRRRWQGGGVMLPRPPPKKTKWTTRVSPWRR